MAQQVKIQEELKGLELDSLSFRHDGYGSERKFVGSARLSKGGIYSGSGVRELTIELGPEMASEIVRLLSPAVVASASKAAQALADESKALAEGFGEAMLKIGNGEEEAKEK